MEDKMLIVTSISIAIICCIISFLVGYVKGFRKSKGIDDKIIEEINIKSKLMDPK